MKAHEIKLLELRKEIKSKKYDKANDEAVARVILEDAKKLGKHWVCPFEVVTSYKLSNGSNIECSHRMPARLSDLSIYHSDQFESANIGRNMKAYRMK